VHFNALPTLAFELSFCAKSVQNGGNGHSGQIVGQHLFGGAMLFVTAIVAIIISITTPRIWNALELMDKWIKDWNGME
jgi:hypothetical protein